MRIISQNSIISCWSGSVRHEIYLTLVLTPLVLFRALQGSLRACREFENQVKEYDKLTRKI